MLTALNKRIGNILRKAALDASARVQPATLTEDAERHLHSALIGLQREAGAALAERRYEKALTDLIALSAPVADFFDRIMVMDENQERRANRLALLRDAQRLLCSVADLSRLPG